ncbi:MAG: hypothetical protein BIFFINMI_00251 [Phycisphaerae bacterium]|nr:hypothetical protein [Phycisphaerae bacterium]
MDRIARLVCLAGLIALIPASLMPPTALAADPPAPAGAVVLDGRTNLRWTQVFRRPQIKADALKAAGQPADKPKELGIWGVDSPAPPADWMAESFDDSQWPTARLDEIGRVAFAGYDVRAVLFRARLNVTDPSAVKSLRLTLAFHGGVVVCLNGREVARASMPEGPATAMTPAAPYPDEAFVGADGKALPELKGKPDTWEPDLRRRVGLRSRSAVLDLPPAALHKGVNVLAVSIHAADFNAACTAWFSTRYSQITTGRNAWSLCGLRDLSLSADGGVAANVARPAGIQVWNSDICDRLNVLDYGDPNLALSPIRLVGARNGRFAGRVVVSSDKPITGLKVVAGDLKSAEGAAAIPASAVRVQFALPTGSAYRYVNWFDGLSETPPNPAPVSPQSKGAVVPVRVSVVVPPDAKAGDYRGTVTLSADGLAATAVPVELNVADWTIPDPDGFQTVMSVYQSPTTLAKQYKVQEWSEEHWKLIEKSFELLGRIGSDIVMLTVINHTQLGNEEGMVVWIRKPDGSYDYDYSRAERYLALARKYLHNPQWVVLHCWNTGGWKTPGVDEKCEVTVQDPGTGQRSAMQVPVFGTDEAVKFWTPVLHGLRDRLDKMGWGRTIAVGTLSDSDPPDEVSGMFAKMLPEAGWHRGCHRSTFADTPTELHGGKGKVSCWEYVYGLWELGPPMALPKLPPIGLYNGPGIRFLRREFDSLTPLNCLTVAERCLYLHSRGVGRVCLDFWPVIGDKRRPTNIYNRWPESSCDQREPTTMRLAWPGPDGALPTVRFENMIQSVQEAEALIFINRALARQADALGADLADRCRKLIADRIVFSAQRYSNVFGEVLNSTNYLGWQELNARLWSLAAEVQTKLPPTK